MTPLQRRLLDLVPALDYGLDVFLRLLRIEETEAIPTAAVPLGRAPRLRINPRFVEQHCPTDEDLLVLVLHELHHVLLGHTRLYRRVTPAHNIAFDAVINAMICRRSPDLSHSGLFRHLNAPDQVPALLLRPPEGFPGPPVYADSVGPRWRELLDDLYYTGTGTFEEVFDAITVRVNLDLLLDGPGAPVLLGNHGEDPDDASSQDDSGVFDLVRSVAEAWPESSDPRVGRTLSDALEERTAVPTLSPAVQVLRRAILAAARGGARRNWRREVAPAPADLVLPTRDRRAFALRGMGGVPLLYRGTLQGRGRPRGIEPVSIYVDVSESCREWIGELFGAIRACRGLVSPTIYTFSNKVVPITLEDVVAGRYRSTCGTSGEAVTAHIHEHRPGAAVVLTDGEVGRIPSRHARACKNARLQVVLTPRGSRRDLAPVATAFHSL